MLDASGKLAAAQLGIYSPLTLLSALAFYYHSDTGALGWLYLIIFCILRLIGCALEVSAGNSGTTGGAVFSSLGLSPLSVGMMAILREATRLRQNRTSFLVNWLPITSFHSIVAVAVILVATGAAGLTSSDPTKSDQRLEEAGMIIFLMAWLFLIGMVYLNVVSRFNDSSLPTYRFGCILLYGLITTILLLGIRFFFGIVGAFTNDAKLNPVTGDVTINVLLNVLPEVLALSVLLGVGLATRRVKEVKRANGARLDQVEIGRRVVQVE